MIEVRDLTLGYFDAPPVLQQVSLRVGKGEVVNVLGPNGCGKTTLLRAILGFLPVPLRSVFLEGRPQEEISRRDIARTLAYVPQMHTGVFAYQVLDVVLMGRTARSPWLRFSADDVDRAMNALEQVRMTSCARKSYLELSGGQRQLVLIARALCQGCSALVMDEPVTGLDYGNQFHLLELIGELSGSGPAIMLTTHHPEQAVYLGGRAILLKAGHVVADGPVSTTVTAQQIKDLYNLPPRAQRWMHLTEPDAP